MISSTVCLALLITAGCGGGGSGTAAGGSGNPTTPPPDVPFTRDVPGGTVTVVRLAAGADGSLRFRVDFTGGPQALAVSAWLGPAYDSPNAQAVGVQQGGHFVVSFPAAPAEDANLWIRTRLSDGALVEVGGPDLPALP